MKELHKSCQKEDGTDDQKKGTQLLEVYAIEIQMYTETKNNKKLKVCLCSLSSSLQSSQDPKITSCFNSSNYVTFYLFICCLLDLLDTFACYLFFAIYLIFALPWNLNCLTYKYFKSIYMYISP